MPVVALRSYSFVIILLIFISLRCTVQGKHISAQDCQNILTTWLDELGAQLDPDTSSVPVNWTKLDQLLKAESCQYDKLWVELWTVSHLPTVTPAKQKKYRSPEYFDKSYLCESLDEDVFVHHSTQSHNYTNDNDKALLSRFKHVVEPEYFFRLCPCGKRTSEHKCDCEYNESSQPYCSLVHNATAELAAEAKVFPWCRRRRRRPETQNGDYENERASINPPSIAEDCSVVDLSGTVASCTPVQDTYDRVQITLHKVNNSVTECDFNRHHLEQTAESFVVQLQRSNETHGTFNVKARNLQSGSSYCMTYKLVDHPYCHIRPIGVLDPNSAKSPAVCSTHMKAPIRIPGTSDCQETSGPGLHGVGIPYYVLIGFLILVALIGFVCCAAACWYCRNKTRSNSREQIVSSGCNKPLMDSDSSPNKPKASLLLLHAPSNTPSSFNGLNRQLRDWLKTIADENEEVLDLSDDDHLESIAEGQEQWVTDLMVHPDSRIIVVNSPSSVQLISGKSSTETEGLLHEEAAGDDDPLRDLRRFAFNRLQSHFSGKYRQVLVVSYKDLKPITKDLENLTPNRQCLLIPDQLSEISGWVRNSSHGSRSPVSGRSSKLECHIRDTCDKQSAELNSKHLYV